MATANTEMKERLRLAAARCIVHSDPRWWSEDMTDAGEFSAAEAYSDAGDLCTAEDAANYLLLVAEAIDE